MMSCVVVAPVAEVLTGSDFKPVTDCVAELQRLTKKGWMVQHQ